MELFSVINEPAVLGTALFLTALASVWPLPVSTEARQPIALFSKATAVLLGAYTILAAVLALVLHLIRTTDISGILLLGSCYVLVSVFAIERAALAGVTLRQAAASLLWRAVALSVATILLWWWPW